MSKSKKELEAEAKLAAEELKAKSNAEQKEADSKLAKEKEAIALAAVAESDAKLAVPAVAEEAALPLSNEDALPDGEDLESEDEAVAESEYPAHWSEHTIRKVKKAEEAVAIDEENHKNFKSKQGVTKELQFDFDGIVDGKIRYPKGKHSVPVATGAAKFWIVRGAKEV
jgi:hypothetical protein